MNDSSVLKTNISHFSAFDFWQTDLETVHKSEQLIKVVLLFQKECLQSKVVFDVNK